MNTKIEPEIHHPEWCDRERCDFEPDGGVHWGERHSLDLHTVAERVSEDATCQVTLSMSHDDAEPLVWLEVNACETITLADLRRFADWLTSQAEAAIEAVAAEGTR